MTTEIQKKVADFENTLAELREAVNQILESGMKEKTVLILLAHYTKMSQRDIKRVLFGIQNLEAEYFGEE